MTTLSPDFARGFVPLLRLARDKYESSKDPENKRISWIYFIELCHDFIREIDPAVDQEALLAPLNDLILSLFSLNFGVVDASLRPQKPKHRPSDPRWAMFRGHAAAASQLLIRDGAAASDADLWVAKRLGRDGYKSADLRITEATIRGWRKAAREGRSDELIRTVFVTVVEGRNPQVWELLPKRSPVYEVWFRDGKEERLKNVPLSAMMRALFLIDLIRHYFPTLGSPEK